MSPLDAHGPFELVDNIDYGNHQQALAWLAEHYLGPVNVATGYVGLEGLDALADAPVPAQPEPGLTSADVEEAIRATLAEMPQPESGMLPAEVGQMVKTATASTPTPQPGFTTAQMVGAIRTALAAMPQPEPGLAPDDVNG